MSSVGLSIRDPGIPFRPSHLDIIVMRGLRISAGCRVQVQEPHYESVHDECDAMSMKGQPM